MLRFLRATAPAFVAAALWTGCSTVAAVLLDVPEQPQPAPGTGHAGQPAPSTTPGTLLTERTPPPIERISDRDSILALLPRDDAGGVDWVAALRDGIVDPQWSSRSGSGPPDTQDFDFDFVLKGPNEVFDAVFPHSSHVSWVSCQSCHSDIFRYRGEPITMEAVNAGEACGRCHGTVAFAVSTCVRCHEGMPAFEPITEPLGGDVILARAGDKGMEDAFPQARFPHWRHRIRYRCTACHPSLFSMRAGTDTLTMSTMGEGVACGTCHDGTVAFGLSDCLRCHVSAAE